MDKIMSIVQNIMSIIENIPDWLWWSFLVYFVGVAALTALRWYIGGQDGAVHVLIVAFFPITLPYIAISNLLHRLIRWAKNARAMRLIRELGYSVSPDYWDHSVAEDKLRYYAKRFHNADVYQAEVRKSGDKTLIAEANRNVEIVKQDFWRCHEAYRLLGYDVKKKYKDYL